MVWSRYLLLMVVSPMLAESFILDGPSCAANKQCQCSYNAVTCNFMSLPEVPNFTPIAATTTAHKTPEIYIRLSGNRIMTIRARAFQNLTMLLSNDYRIIIYLDTNGVHTIEPDAFIGVENKLSQLWLQSNRLRTIPSAFASLRSLEKLYIHDNPIHSLDASAVSSLGKSLAYLRIDVDSFQSWPYNIGGLQMLKTLVLGHVADGQLPSDGLQGLNSSLQSLVISHSNLTTVPLSLCGLSSLKVFTFSDNNIRENNTSLFKKCPNDLANLTTIWLNRNNLKSFSNVLHAFPYIRGLNFEENNIAAVDPILVPSQNEISSLNMNKNKLSSIPSGVAKMKSLDELKLSYNKITSIDDRSLAGLTKLTYIDIDGNPLRHVTPGAFRDNHDMHHLSMEQCSLTAVPTGVTSLPKLYLFSFMGNPVVCNCSMAYLKSWDFSSVATFTALCDDPQNTDLKKYILGPLQNCPSNL